MHDQLPVDVILLHACTVRSKPLSSEGNPQRQVNTHLGSEPALLLLPLLDLFVAKCVPSLGICVMNQISILLYLQGVYLVAQSTRTTRSFMMDEVVNDACTRKEYCLSD